MARKRKPKNGNKTLKRKVTEKEVVEFQKKANNFWVFKRSEIIRLAAMGYNNCEIQEITGINEKNVRFWIRRFNEEGFDGLKRKTSDVRRGKLTKEQIHVLKNHIRKSPEEFGYNAIGWTAKLVWKHIEKMFGVKYHRRYIYYFIRQIGFKLVKPYVTNKKQDVEEVRRFYKQVLPAVFKKNENLKVKV